jgi:Protein of unknown function (DUF3293)
MIDQRLLPLYLATHYEVQAPGGPFTLRIDQPSAALAAAHRAHDVECSAFLTAWNPRGRRADTSANQRAQQALLAVLEQQRLVWWPGRGVDPTGRWPAEDSLLVFGMDEFLARSTGVVLAQMAVVVAEVSAVPRLLWL